MALEKWVLFAKFRGYKRRVSFGIIVQVQTPDSLSRSIKKCYNIVLFECRSPKRKAARYALFVSQNIYCVCSGVKVKVDSSILATENGEQAFVLGRLLRDRTYPSPAS